jgi:hypothetical protein
MWSFVMRTGVACLWVILVSGAARADLCANNPNSVSVNAWDTWEQQLVSQNDYSSTPSNMTANAQDDVNLTVTIKNCGTGYTFTQSGFWYGLTPPDTMHPQGMFDAHQYRIRASLPAGVDLASSTWQWTTACAKGKYALPAALDCSQDSGLTPKTGKIQVLAAPSSSKRRLPRGGFLDTSNNGHFLTLARPGAYQINPGTAEGSPFFWLGDTVWDASILATEADWESYVDQRTAGTHPFTVVQIAVSPSSAASPLVDRSNPGNPPFDSQANCTADSAALALNSCTRFNPLYWAGMDAKIQYANQKGLVVMLAGIMDPYQKSLDNCSTSSYSARAVEGLARNLGRSFFSKPVQVQGKPLRSRGLAQWWFKVMYPCNNTKGIGNGEPTR